MAAMSLEHFLQNYRDTIDRLYSTSNATVWHVSRASFAAALWRSFDRRHGVAEIGGVVEGDRNQHLDNPLFHANL